MRRLLFENLRWKLLSLAIAIVLWIVVVGRPSSIMRMLPSQVRLHLEHPLNPEAH